MSSSVVEAITDCTLWNLSGHDVTFGVEKDWVGHAATSPPKIIQNHKAGHFKHIGSVAAVTYVLAVKDIGSSVTWVTAWSNLVGNPHNKVLTKLVHAGTKIDWDKIKTELEHSGSTSFGHFDGYVSYAKIELNTDKPKMISVLHKGFGDEQNTDSPNLASILKDVE